MHPGDDAYNSAKFSEAVWALGNGHRHLHGWNASNKSALEKNPSVKVLRRLDVDPLAFDTAYQVLNKCAFRSYHEFEQRVLSIPRALLGPGADRVTATASEWSLSIFPQE